MSENSKVTNSVEVLKLKKRQTLSPKLDVVFQALFGETGSERITSFSQNCLDRQIRVAYNKFRQSKENEGKRRE